MSSYLVDTNILLRSADRSHPSSTSATNAIEILLLPLLPETPAIFEQWEKLVKTYEVKGVNVHDARLYQVRVIAYNGCWVSFLSTQPTFYDRFVSVSECHFWAGYFIEITQTEAIKTIEFWSVTIALSIHSLTLTGITFNLVDLLLQLSGFVGMANLELLPWRIVAILGLGSSGGFFATLTTVALPR
ncbi:hypothetical protein [Dactylococcopsis salina]|uniref:PIN domain-containing protein n=1 Tax=Dactylococcopsis salina (strain PCC 8305) TaxID=13035 RepID=K9YT00_DACS8|nr:hypothetical protein [Dactylococcopsis salina]AFZ49485.1 hypothetical protein Dacsa_0728 [Dactylococcopsis salina PCC 8305]